MILRRAFPIASLVFLALSGCSPADPRSGVQDFPNTVQAALRDGLIELPSSVQSPSPSAQVSLNGEALARAQAALSDSDEVRAWGVYLMVPVYLHWVEKARRDLTRLVDNIAHRDLPERWEGWVEDSLWVITDVSDTILEGKSARVLSVAARRNGALRFALRIVELPGGGYDGWLIGLDPTGTRFGAEFEAPRGADASMTLAITRDTNALEKPSDPAKLRVRVVRKSNGRLAFSGASYHPLFRDDFWTETPKIYAFKGIADPKSDRAILWVAFGDASGADSLFYEKNAMDQAILRRATEKLRQRFMDSASWWKVVSYCLEYEISLEEAYADHALELLLHTPAKPAAEFNERDLLQYLELNRQAILERRAGFADTRGIYFLIRARQPLYLRSEATLIAYGQSPPAGFPLALAELDSLNPDRRVPEEISSMEIEP